MARKHKERQKPVICPYCRRTAVLRSASYVYGKDTLNPNSYLYVCSGYPECDAYVGVHEKSMRPKGTLANSDLRNKRIQAHRALDALWNRLNLRERDMHIGMFSEYLCGETIRECTEFVKLHQRLRKGGHNFETRKQNSA